MYHYNCKILIRKDCVSMNKHKIKMSTIIQSSVFIVIIILYSANSWLLEKLDNEQNDL